MRKAWSIVNKLLETDMPDSAFDYAASTLTPTFGFGSGSDLDLGKPERPPDAYLMRQYALKHWKNPKHVMLFVYDHTDGKNERFKISVLLGEPDGKHYTTYEQNIRDRGQMNACVRKLDELFSRGLWDEYVTTQFNHLGPWERVAPKDQQIQFDPEGNPH